MLEMLKKFDLSGKVAIVTGCNTGLGQGMAVGLAQAGCDIVGVNLAEAPETAEKNHRTWSPLCEFNCEFNATRSNPKPCRKSSRSLWQGGYFSEQCGDYSP
ncbi:hypothetical protein [Avibacterium paragallinarum]|uniref:hypothetical protein n=1 Tax=Avibacterium paragallinarum TaxID=728 RepID=UPI0021BE7408|nr:hypothetical protein [Avibacterium paragallinarum]